jgi:hypothetical protein
MILPMIINHDFKYKCDVLTQVLLLFASLVDMAALDDDDDVVLLVLLLISELL